MFVSQIVDSPLVHDLALSHAGFNLISFTSVLNSFFFCLLSWSFCLPVMIHSLVSIDFLADYSLLCCSGEDFGKQWQPSQSFGFLKEPPWLFVVTGCSALPALIFVTVFRYTTSGTGNLLPCKLWFLLTFSSPRWPHFS